MKRQFTRRELRLLRAEADQTYEGIRGARFFRDMDFFLYLCLVVIAALAIRSFIAEPIRVDGDSMIPTLVNGEHMFVEKLSYWTRAPERGEIVICFYPGYKESCVKRVIGLPGDSVSVESGRVVINGAPLDESEYWDGEIFGDMAPVTVGEGQVFVMGDNRNGSKDSRNSSVGCIPYMRIVGRVRAVFWPLKQLHSIEKVVYPT